MNALLLAGLVALNARAAGPKPVWELKEGLSAPESAYVVPGKDWLLVSNVAGDAAAKDGVGWISKVSLDGKMLEAKWATGFNAPKGLRASGSKLYVADIDELVELELATGKVLRRHRAQGAKMLNDVAVDSAGKVYVSDTLGNKIYRLEKAGLIPYIEGEQLEGPNGLAVKGGSLFVACWGPGVAADWSTKGPGKLLSFGLKTKTRRDASPAFGNLDGLEWTGDSWLATDWVGGKVYRVKDSKPELLLDGLKGGAGLGWHGKRRLYIVPRMQEDALSAYKL